MAPKAVDKGKKEVKAKMVEDKTFGMKNKNKSKTVQKYIKQIHQGITCDSNRAIDDKKKEKAKEEKAQGNSALMNSLFNLSTDKKGKAYDPIAKKKAEQLEEEAIAAGKKLKEDVIKQIIEGIANTIRLTNPKTGIRMSEMGGHPIILALKEKLADTFRTIQLLLFIKAREKVFWVDDRESSNPIIRCQEDVDCEEAPDDRTLEEILEEKRKMLTGPGTPINEETFKAWKLKKEQERLAKVEELRASTAKKTGGKVQHAGMSGRDLFTYDASLFVDDEEAVDANEYEEREDRLASESEDEDDNPPAKAAAAEPAAGSREAPAAADVAINKDLFLQGEDDLDDLDDLDDDDEDDDDPETCAGISFD